MLLLLLSAAPAAQGPTGAASGREARPTVNGRVLDQALVAGQGYTVLHVWGSHYEMGYAYGYLMADWVQLAYEEISSTYAYYWPAVRSLVSEWTFLPEEIEAEFAGILDGVRAWYPETTADVLDLKAGATFGDWAYSYACRSTCVWGEWVAPPTATVSVRKLQFPLLPTTITQQWHHTLCAWQPTDGGTSWVTFSPPGSPSAPTCINEFGTIASNHDWNSSVGPHHPTALPRTIATRYALTMPLGPDPLTHLQTVFAELSGYAVATGGFLNYYVPEGGAGVIKTSKSLGFYAVRWPQPAWMNGQVISTNNSDIDGTSGIEPWVTYYSHLDPLGGVYATLTGLWDVAWQSTDLHVVAVEVRDRGEMTFWYRGRLENGTTERVAVEWDELFFAPASILGEDVAGPAATALRAYPNPAQGVGRTAVTIPVRIDGALSATLSNGDHSISLEIITAAGRSVRRLRPLPQTAIGQVTDPRVRLFAWDGRDSRGRPVPAGVYHWRLPQGARGDTPVPAGRIVWMGD